MPSEAEDQVTSLPDVDVVPGDVVEEQKRLPGGQAVHVGPAEVNDVVITPGLFHLI